MTGSIRGQTVFVKQWSGHSKPSMLSDVYGHVMIEPAGDEWRSFWLAAYQAQTQPKRPENASLEALERRSR